MPYVYLLNALRNDRGRPREPEGVTYFGLCTGYSLVRIIAEPPPGARFNSSVGVEPTWILTISTGLRFYIAVHIPLVGLAGFEVGKDKLSPQKDSNTGVRKEGAAAKSLPKISQNPTTSCLCG